MHNNVELFYRILFSYSKKIKFSVRNLINLIQQTLALPIVVFRNSSSFFKYVSDEALYEIINRIKIISILEKPTSASRASSIRCNTSPIYESDDSN